jgi:hypothetical protein
MTAPQKGCPFCDGGPQGLRRPRFSFFRFTCQTARQALRPPLLNKPKPIAEPTKHDPRRLLGGLVPHISEDLQARHRADSGRRAVCPGL